MNAPAIQPPPSSKLLTAGAGWLAIAVGLTVLTGWVLDSPLLKSGVPGGVAVKANALLAVGPERRLVALKQEINALCARLGEAPAYPTISAGLNAKEASP